MTLPLARAEGAIPALLTPYAEDGSPNLSELERITASLIERGVHGFYVGGSTGDGVMQTPQERLACVETVVKTAAGQVPVIAHVGTTSTRGAIELGQQAVALGADAISSILPSVPLAPADQLRYFTTLAHECEAPFIAYNFPGRTGGINLGADFFAELAAEPHVAGVKFTSMDLFQLNLISRIGDGRLTVWNGHDEVMLAGLLSGARGAIGSTFNVFTHLPLHVLDQYRAGDFAGARATQDQICDMVRDLIAVDVMGALRELMTLQGFAMGQARHPQRVLDAQEKAAVAAMYAAHGDSISLA